MKIKNCKIENYKSAFTLIEMMVVITILGIVMSMLILTFRNSKTRDLEITSQQVKTALEEAMSYSLGPREGDSNINGYGVCFENTGSGWTYSLYKNKVTVIPPPINYDCDDISEIIKTADFKKNIEVSGIKDSANPLTTPTQFSVFFGIPQNTADASADDPAIPYDRIFYFDGQTTPAIEFGDIILGIVSETPKQKVRVDVITGSITIP